MCSLELKEVQALIACHSPLPWSGLTIVAKDRQTQYPSCKGQEPRRLRGCLPIGQSDRQPCTHPKAKYRTAQLITNIYLLTLSVPSPQAIYKMTNGAITFRGNSSTAQGTSPGVYGWATLPRMRTLNAWGSYQCMDRCLEARQRLGLVESSHQHWVCMSLIGGDQGWSTDVCDECDPSDTSRCRSDFCPTDSRVPFGVSVVGVGGAQGFGGIYVPGESWVSALYMF